jgi:hypothetical protein
MAFKTVLILSSALSLSTPLLAQTADTAASTQSGKRVYPAEFFNNFSPVTALDMINRVPGFSFNNGGDARGFGTNAGNVLIDGDRPSTKSNDLSTLLSRIPASQVERLELSEQAGSAADAQGQSQILNVIRKDQASVSGTYEANIEAGESGDIRPFGKSALTIRRGDTSYDLSADYFSQFNRIFGPEYITNGNGQLTLQRNFEIREKNNNANLAGAIKTRKGDVKMNFNAKYIRDNTISRRNGDVLDASGNVLGLEKLLSRSPDKKAGFEVGADIEFPLTNTISSKFVVLYNQFDIVSKSRIDVTGSGLSPFSFDNVNDNTESEAIVRTQNSWVVNSQHNIQFGIEGALNQLDASFRSTNSGQVLPSSNVNVRERRIEPFISDVWAINPKWKLETGLIAEKSTLEVSGDSNAERSFLFWKPRVIATWTINPSTSLELRAERRVAQLDFNDFATSVDLALGGQVDAGNADLLPQRTSTFSSKLRRTFWERGSVQLLGSYVFVSDTQDLVPITLRDNAGNLLSRFDGPGNIGDSKQWNIEFDLTLPLDKLNLALFKGAEIKYTGHYHGSSVTDPVTQQSRRLSSRPLHHHYIEYRQDIDGKGLAWGGNVYWSADASQYFYNQINRRATNPEVVLFAEYNKLSLGKLRFQIDNVSDVALERERTFFVDDRASGIINQRITRDWRRDMRFLFTLSGDF